MIRRQKGLLSGVQVEMGKKQVRAGGGVGSSVFVRANPSRGPVQQAGGLFGLHPERDKAWRLVVTIRRRLKAMPSQGRRKAMDGIDARVGCRGGWHPHEASHISVGVGVWGHAWRGDALWRHEAGSPWASRPWTGPQGVLQLKREGKRIAENCLAQKLRILPCWLSHGP